MRALLKLKHKRGYLGPVVILLTLDVVQKKNLLCKFYLSINKPLRISKFYRVHSIRKCNSPQSLNTTTDAFKLCTRI